MKLNYKEEIIKLEYMISETFGYLRPEFKEGGNFEYATHVLIEIHGTEFSETRVFSYDQKDQQETAINEMYEKLYHNLKKKLGI